MYYPKIPIMRKLRVVELYAGIGRTWEPFRKWKRCELALMVNRDELAYDNYTANYLRAPYWRRDLSFVRPSAIQVAAEGPIDILLGCPPCQGFSDTGKRDPDDPRNAHVSAFGSYVVALQPRAVAMENVPLLAGSKRFRLFTRKLERAGYRWTAAIVNAALYGSCQTRQRLLLVAFRADVGITPSIPLPSHGGSLRYFGYQSGKFATLQENPLELLGTTPGSGRVAEAVRVTKTPGSLAIPTVSEVLDGLPRLGSADAVSSNQSPPLYGSSVRSPSLTTWES